MSSFSESIRASDVSMRVKWDPEQWGGWCLSPEQTLYYPAYADRCDDPDTEYCYPIDIERCTVFGAGARHHHAGGGQDLGDRCLPRWAGARLG